MTATTLNLGASPDPAADTAALDHDKAMADKFDATAQAAKGAAEPTTGNTPPATPADPELIGGEFKTQDELLAAYKALKEGKAAPEAAKPADPAAIPPVVPADPAKPDAAAQAVTDAGLDMNALSSEWAEKGALSEENYAKLAKAGIPKDVVAAYAAGQQALASQMRDEVFSAVGIKSAQDFTSVVEWAGKNLQPAEIEAYNKAVGPGTTKAQAQMAVEALYGRYSRSQGSDPTLVRGQAVQPTGQAYQSAAQWKAEMADPRYAKDPAFRANVMAKLSRSNI